MACKRKVCNSKTLGVGCIFYSKLPNDIKQVGNNQFKNGLKDLIIKECYYSTEDYLKEEFCNTGY